MLVGQVHVGGQTLPYLTFLAPALVGAARPGQSAEALSGESGRPQ